MNISAMSGTRTKTLNKQALVDVYEQHSPGIYRYAHRLLGSRELAEECVSETFSRFLHALKNGRGPTENTQAYLYRIAHNWITDRYRRPSIQQVELDPDGKEEVHSNPSILFAQNMEIDRVRKALQNLPLEQQRVIIMRFLDDLSHAEVALALGKTTEATRALQYRAITSLRKMLIE